MTKWRKKPVVIEAEVYRVGMEDGFDTIGETITNGLRLGEYRNPCKFKGVPYINTLEGKHYISEGDYIITGIKGERYPCKPDIFHQTYEPVEENIGMIKSPIKACITCKYGEVADDGVVYCLSSSDYCAGYSDWQPRLEVID